MSDIAVGRPVARTAPAQIPACRFLAPGSSKILASVSASREKTLLNVALLLPAVRLALLNPALPRRTMFPLPATYFRQPLPLVIGATVSEYYELI